MSAMYKTTLKILNCKNNLLSWVYLNTMLMENMNTMSVIWMIFTNDHTVKAIFPRIRPSVFSSFLRKLSYKFNYSFDYRKFKSGGFLWVLFLLNLLMKLLLRIFTLCFVINFLKWKRSFFFCEFCRRSVFYCK